MLEQVPVGSERLTQDENVLAQLHHSRFVVVVPRMVELLDSAIEAVADRISLELHPLSKRAKDMGRAAQAVALAVVAVVWGVILLG